MSGLPELVRPMLATAGPLPPVGEDAGWAYEMKWDGVRAVTYVSARGTVRLLTRNDREVAASYPDVIDLGLGAALDGLACVLDGELVAFDAGRPSFGALQRRMHVGSPTKALLEAVPVSYLVFDVLHLDGRSLLGETYDTRRAILADLPSAGTVVHVPPAFLGGGADALATSRAQGLEGVVAKRRSSVYEPGRRSRCWTKVKNLRTQEVVLGGWKPGQGRRSGGIGSLLLGLPDADGLAFAGHVGTGFTAAALAALAAQLRPYERSSSPFLHVPREHSRDARWVEPVLVGEVTFHEWTGERRLRHPVWRGLRPDKDPADVRLEP